MMPKAQDYFSFIEHHKISVWYDLLDHDWGANLSIPAVFGQGPAQHGATLKEVLDKLAEKYHLGLVVPDEL